MKPNLFLIGAQKCGTTSISNLLNLNDQIFFIGGDVYEPEYFYTENNGGKKYKNIDEYLSIFPQADKNLKYIGEKSVIYLQSRCALNNIKSFSPNAKIIVCVRDPIDMMESLDFHMKREGFIDSDYIHSLLKDPTYWKYITEKEKNVRLKLHLDYFSTCNLGQQIENLFEIFARKNILILKFEDIQLDPEKTCQKLTEFLEVDFTDLDMPHKNQSAEPKFVVLRDILKSFVALKSKFGIHMNTGLLSYLERINRVPLKIKWSAEIRHSVRIMLSDDIQKLNAIVDTDYDYS